MRVGADGAALWRSPAVETRKDRSDVFLRKSGRGWEKVLRVNQSGNGKDNDVRRPEDVKPPGGEASVGPAPGRPCRGRK